MESGDWLHAFRRDGYVVLESFLPVDLVDALRANLQPLLDARWQAYRAGDRSDARGPARLAVDVEAFVRRHGGARAGAAYLAHSDIETRVGRIFGGARWHRGWAQVECPWPGSEMMGWHSDQTLATTPHPERPGPTIRVTYNIPLVDFVDDNGPLQIVPGSQARPRAELARPDLVQPAADDIVTLALRRGDVLLRDGNMLHRGTPNVSDAPRPMLDRTYHRTTVRSRLRRWRLAAGRMAGRLRRAATGRTA